MPPVCKHPRGFRASSALWSPPLGTNGFPCGAVGLDKLMDPGTSSTGYSHLHLVLAGHADMVVSMNGGPQYRSQNTIIHHVLWDPKMVPTIFGNTRICPVLYARLGSGWMSNPKTCSQGTPPGALWSPDRGHIASGLSRILLVLGRE